MSQSIEPCDIREVIRSLPILSELLEEEDGEPRYCRKNERDQMLDGYTHGLSGVWVDPCFRLVRFKSGEEIMRQGDRDGNKLYIPVRGELEVGITDNTGKTHREKLAQEVPFGEMALLADAERNATISVPPGVPEATVLEISRAALETLRNLPRFRQAIDDSYRSRSFTHLMREVQSHTRQHFTPEELEALQRTAKFMVYGKHHTLFQKENPVEKIILIKDGWVRRDYGDRIENFLGEGNCLGLTWNGEDSRWAYDATVMARTEVLEFSIDELRRDAALFDKAVRILGSFSHYDGRKETNRERLTPTALEAVREEISTGIVDARNLLVMDMDKCIRCGNCSLACQKVHGHSRLLRRGIHIERPVKLQSRSSQHVLVPQVCIQCKNAECLTECPTGAVFRDRRGMIDINADICIGCTMCAQQCPYDAIWMIARPEGVAAPALAPVEAKAADGKTTAAAAPADAKRKNAPQVAVKCNLCEDTPLNPTGVKKRRKAYSCEENCPTGALVRVSPREYFGEIKETLGEIIFRDKTHAIGRNIHRSDPVARVCHVVGVLLVAGLIAGALWLLRPLRYDMNARLGGEWWSSVRWLTGIFGGLAGVLTAALYLARKRIYTRRVGPLRYWRLAHVYMGMLAAVLLLVHGGNITGGALTTWLHVSFDAVIVTGLFGSLCYFAAPRIMTSIEEQPLLIEDLLKRRLQLRKRLIEIKLNSNDHLRYVIDEKVLGHLLSAAYLLRQYVLRERLPVVLEKAHAMFEPEMTGLDNAEARERLKESVETAATLCRVNSLILLHKLLKAWLVPHIISTFLMLALMAAHIAQVFYFRVR